jgi:DNA polymerase V
MLLNLCQPSEYTDDLFAVSQPSEPTNVMAVLDKINERWGRGTACAASVSSNPDWSTRCEQVRLKLAKSLLHAAIHFAVAPAP